ncbi:MAG: hypothetical protein OXE92_02525 [Bacteroidetes bacterium]|nr:hypothetical protein [Bacteroidota bacterium]MCY4204583.1 hypothetical protein [Bacteroidota bacterium]
MARPTVLNRSKVRSPKIAWGFQGKKKVSNGDRYHYRTSQMGDALRMRLQSTLALQRGEVRVTEGEC